MAISQSANLSGSVGANAANATQVMLPTVAVMVQVAISGTGAARFAKGSPKVTPALSATTDGDILAGSGYQLLLAEPGSGGISSIFLYANNGETLTYDIMIIKSGVSQ